MGAAEHRRYHILSNHSQTLNYFLPAIPYFQWLGETVHSETRWALCLHLIVFSRPNTFVKSFWNIYREQNQTVPLNYNQYYTKKKIHCVAFLIKAPFKFKTCHFCLQASAILSRAQRIWKSLTFTDLSLMRIMLTGKKKSPTTIES